jgi:hypothetical protein
MKMGSIGPRGQLNANGWLPVITLIELLKAATNLAGLYAHHGIFAGGIIRRPMKYLGSDGSFFQVIRSAIELAVHDVFKELATSLTVFEEPTGEHPIELLNDARAELSIGSLNLI